MLSGGRTQKPFTNSDGLTYTTGSLLIGFVERQVLQCNILVNHAQLITESLTRKSRWERHKNPTSLVESPRRLDQHYFSKGRELSSTH